MCVHLRFLHLVDQPKFMHRLKAGLVFEAQVHNKRLLYFQHVNMSYQKKTCLTQSSPNLINICTQTK